MSPSFRLSHIISTLLLLLICIHSSPAAADRYAIQRRADPPATTPTPSITNIPSSTGGSQDVTTSPSGGDSSGTASAATTSQSPSSSGSGNETAAASTSSSASASSVPTSLSDGGTGNYSTTIFNATLTPDALPITPAITPAFSVGGVLLILSGTAYALIGMKNKLIHIFLSAAYLSSLSVTVLILYVMTPPITNAIQGAYVVAIVMTGVIIGGAALIFTEMTEGLGCLFGGFTFSMWLLVLAPGGLLKTTGSISAFIAAFTVAVFATSFSHYTRPYGLIGSISFGGATAVVMGIDCFSRAGLKEFWAYIFNLNQNLFPLGATTYPLTKGMKVEIAAIIVIFLAGLVSQTRLWNIIKTNREKRAAQRLEDDRHVEQEEANVGRRVELETKRARKEWEGVYGDAEANKSSSDSGIGMDSSFKKGARSTTYSTRKSGEDEIEMAPIRNTEMSMAGAGLATKDVDGVMVVRVVEDDIPLDDSGKPLERRLSQKSHQGVSADKIWTVGADGEARPLSAISKRNSLRDSFRKSTGPEVTPLPFRVPEGGEGAEKDEDDRSSIATMASEMGKRGSMLLRSLSKRSQGKRNSASRLSQVSLEGVGFSVEKLVGTKDIEEDRRSSVAATLDGMSDTEDGRSLSGISVPRSRASMLNFSDPPKSPKDDDLGPRSPTIVISNADDEYDKAVAAARSPTAMSVPKIQVPAPVARPGSVKSNPSAATATPAPLTKDALPPTVSKVVMSYRTNEWAKHLSAAEAPVPEALNLKSYPDPSAATALKLQTPSSTAFATANNTISNSTTEQASAGEVREIDAPLSSPTRISSPPLPSSTPTIEEEAAAPLNIAELTQSASEGAVPPAAPLRSASQASLHRGGPPSAHKNGSGGVMGRGYSLRNSSAPNVISSGGVIVESPIEDESGFGGHGFAQNASTLMGQRDSILKNKSSTGTFASARDYSGSSQGQFVNGNGSSDPLRSASVNSFRQGAGGLIAAAGTSASPSPYSNSSQVAISRIGSETAKDEDDDDVMSLSARKRLMRQNSAATSVAGSRNGTVNGNIGGMNANSVLRPGSQVTGFGGNSFDSHQPQRDRMSTVMGKKERESRLGAWRASVAQDLGNGIGGGGGGRASTASPSPYSTGNPMTNNGTGSGGFTTSGFNGGGARQLMEEKKRLEWMRGLEEKERRERERVWEGRMRSGEWGAAHREGLRRMQAEASRKAGGQ